MGEDRVRHRGHVMNASLQATFLKTDHRKSQLFETEWAKIVPEMFEKF